MTALPASTRRTVAILACATFLSGASIRMCDGLLPRIASDSHVTPGTAGWTVSAFALSYSLLQLAFGPLGDRVGKVPVMFGSVCGCAFFALACAFVPDFRGLLVARVLWGVAAAGVVPLAMAYVGDEVPIDQRQAMLANLLLGALSGMTAGQVAGGLFADSSLGWRGAFGSVGLAYVLLVVLLFRQFRAIGWRSGPPARPATAAHRQWMQVLDVRWSWVVLLGALAEGVFVFGAVAFMPTLLQHRFGWTLTAASALMACYAVGGLLYAIAAAGIVRRMGQARMVTAGGCMVGLGFLAWYALPWAWLTGPIALLVGFGTYLAHGTLQVHATQMVPHARATAVALFSAMLFLGQGVGAALAGHAFDHLGPAWMLLPTAVLLPLGGFAYARAMRRHAGN